MLVGVANYKVGGDLKVGVTPPKVLNWGEGLIRKGEILQRLKIINKSVTNFRFPDTPGEKISIPIFHSISTKFPQNFHTPLRSVWKNWEKIVEKEWKISMEIFSPSLSGKLQWLLILKLNITDFINVKPVEKHLSEKMETLKDTSILYEGMKNYKFQACLLSKQEWSMDM